MEPYQERVVEEKRGVDKLLGKLKVFTTSVVFSKLPGEEQGRLNRQHSIMEDYSAVLGERIKAFN